MPHFYPKHLEDFPYIGRYSYALTFSTEERSPLLRERAAITLVVSSLQRGARETGFTIVVWCAMPDHCHLVIDGERDDADCRAFIRRAKQYSGYYFKQRFGRQLWQRYGYERVIRDDLERALTIRYALANPVRAGFVADPRRFAGLGSDLHTVDELIRISGYTSAYALE